MCCAIERIRSLVISLQEIGQPGYVQCEMMGYVGAINTKH